MPARVQARLVVLGLAAVLAALGAGGATGAAEPLLAVAGDAYTDVLAADGTPVQRFGGFDYYSLGGALFAGWLHAGGQDRVEAFDAVTGASRFTVPNAFGPIVLPGGRVAFLPDHSGVRDPQGNSVWLRYASGTIRRLVQFSGGAGLPGIRTHQPDAGAILGLAFSADGRKLAVAEGNDVDLFFYDVWVVSVKTRAAFRATTGNRSRFPTLTPDGGRLAYLREKTSCGGPPPGIRAGDLRTQAARKGATAATLLPGSCARFYTEPHWLSGTELAAVRLTRTAPGTYRSDLVLVDATTKAVTVLDGAGDVFGLSVSPALRRIAYMRQSGSHVRDVDAGTTVELPDLWSPKLAGDGAWP